MRNTLKSVCALLVLSACEAPPENSTGSSPCVEKMKAGKVCGTPETAKMTCSDGSNQVPCPEDETLAAPIDDCVYEYRDCARWCDAVFCSWPSGAGCAVCKLQCRSEYNLCTLNIPDGRFPNGRLQ